MNEKTLTIIDGYGFLFRAYYVLPHLSTSSGVPIGGVYGFINILLKYINSQNTDYLTVVFDTGRKNFRHDIYPKYKINRPKPPDDLIPQFSLLREAVKAFDVSYEEVDGYEADDVIATLSAKYSQYQNLKVIIVTADKDLLQLIGDKVSIFDPIKNRYITEEQINEKFGVGSDQLLDLLSLTGDVSDNIPGVPSIGIKTAAKLLYEFKTLDNLLLNAGVIKQNKCREMLIQYKDQAILSKKLLSLCYSVELSEDIEKYKVNTPNLDILTAFLSKYEFKSLMSRIEKQFNYIKNSTELEDSLTTYTQDSLTEFLVNCKYEGILSIYIEKSDEQILHKITLSFREDNIFIISQEHIENALKVLHPYLRSTSILKIVYDLKKLLDAMPDIDSVDDIMVMSYSVDTGTHNHQLQKIIAHNMNGEVEQISSRTLLKLHSILQYRLFKERLYTIYQRFERPLIKVLYDMERHGILINSAMLEELSKDFSLKISLSEEKIFNLAGEKFSIGSPKQLSEMLFNKLNLLQAKKLKSGIYSTGADVLENLAAEGVEIANEILYWRHFNKLKNTYTDSLIKQINGRTGRVHTNYSMNTTSTGRLSSNNPNLQNIPIRSEEGTLIRRAFVASEGYRIISADYSQIELRLIAHIANVKAFKEAFSKKQDVHEITAKQIFSGSIFDKNLRRKAKSINFGIIYGISAFGLAKKLGISRAEAGSYIDYYFSCYPEIKTYMEEVKLYVREHGYAETLFGRRCFIKDINSKMPTLRNFAERAAINAPLQGTAADIIKRSMIHLAKVLPAGKIMLQVHDELLIEAPESQVIEVAKVIKKVMENVVELSLPLDVDIKVGKNWADMDEIDL